MTQAPGPILKADQLSAACLIMGTPMMMTGLILDILQKHFSDESNIQELSLRNLVWRPDESTNILLETSYNWRPELSGKRAAVLVKRNGFQNERVGIGDALQPVGENPRYETFWRGSYTLFCIANSPATVELLATEVWREIGEFAPVIRAYFNFFKFYVAEIGEIQILEEAQENFLVPVTVNLAFNQKWETRVQAPKLKYVSLHSILK